MKITIIGTHSTGKSTLISKLQQALSEQGFFVGVLSELSRQCPYPINEETSFEAQSWIQNTQINREGILTTMHDIVLCDRATIDNFAYMQHRLSHLDLSLIEARAAIHMQSYATIFKTQKLDLLAEHDGVRSTDEGFRSAIDARIHTLLDKHKAKYTLLEPTAEYDPHIAHMMQVLAPLLEKQRAAA